MRDTRTPIPCIKLNTARLQLRVLRLSDAPALLAIFSDPAVMQYWSHAPWTQVAQAEERITLHECWREAGDSIQLGVFDRQDGALLGTQAVFKVDRSNRRAEIGYALARHAWGKGINSEAMGAVIDWAFGGAGLGLNRLEADIDPLNARSAATLERQGFVREGLLRERWCINGLPSDTALYGLLQRDWQARATPDLVCEMATQNQGAIALPIPSQPRP